jgi:hypothetical protein
MVRCRPARIKWLVPSDAGSGKFLVLVAVPPALGSPVFGLGWGASAVARGPDPKSELWGSAYWVRTGKEMGQPGN